MCLMPPETLVLREILTMRTMKMEFWILYMDHVYDKPVTIASELRTKATTMQQGKIDNIHILKYLKDFQLSFCYPHYVVTFNTSLKYRP